MRSKSRQEGALGDKLISRGHYVKGAGKAARVDTRRAAASIVRRGFGRRQGERWKTAVYARDTGAMNAQSDLSSPPSYRGDVSFLATFASWPLEWAG